MTAMRASDLRYRLSGTTQSGRIGSGLLRICGLASVYVSIGIWKSREGMSNCSEFTRIRDTSNDRTGSQVGLVLEPFECPTVLFWTVLSIPCEIRRFSLERAFSRALVN